MRQSECRETDRERQKDGDVIEERENKDERHKSEEGRTEEVQKAKSGELSSERVHK